jgi:chromosome segregation ATPase
MTTLENMDIEVKKTVPLWACNILIIGMFLTYMIRQDNRDDMVAKQRIERCHMIQEDGIEVMKDLNTTLTEHRVAFNNLESTLGDLQHTLNAHNSAVADYSRQMAEMNSRTADLLERLEKLEEKLKRAGTE